jgi:hypothetical protein
LFHGKLELIVELALLEGLGKRNSQCEHGRRKSRCKDCGTGYCQHGRRKSRCKDCGTGNCKHGRQKHSCKDCGTG